MEIVVRGFVDGPQLHPHVVAVEELVVVTVVGVLGHAVEKLLQFAVGVYIILEHSPTVAYPIAIEMHEEIVCLVAEVVETQIGEEHPR